MKRMGLTAVAGLFLFIAGQNPAGAQSCTMPSAAAGMDARYAGVAACTEVERFNVDTPGGDRTVRIIRDAIIPTDWSEPYPLVRRGIERSAAALFEVTEAQVGNLTVIVSGLQPDPEGGDRPPDASGPDRQWLDGVAWAPRPDGECVMIVYPANTGERALDFTTAHEFFHCVQFQTAWNQMQAFQGGQPNGWWVEGMAEWFANLAIPGTNASDQFIPAFDDTSPRRPLTGFDYDNFIFFSWYAAAKGNAAITPFMRGMATGGGMAGEESKLAERLSPEDMQAFVEAYLDSSISLPGGRAIPSNPRTGDITLFLEDRRLELEADRFVLRRGELVFTCGTWNIGISDEAGSWAVKEEGGSWQPLPAVIEVPPDGEKRYKFGAMGGGEAGFRATLDARWSEGEAGCHCRTQIEGSPNLDSCVVGTWELVSGGGMAWLHGVMEQANRSNPGGWSHSSSLTSTGRRIRFTEHGLFMFGRGVPNAPRRTERAQKDDMVILSQWQGEASSIGSWWIEGETLGACTISYVSEGRYRMEDSTGANLTLRGNYPSDHISGGGYAYSCSETSLHLRALFRGGMMAGMPPMEWEYRRVTGPE